MFVGAINTQVREFLGAVAPAFQDRTVVIGCSGNFTMETVIAATGKPRAVHSNDVSFYTCLAGHWLRGDTFPFTIVDQDYAWLTDFCTSPDASLAAMMILLDMLPFHKRANPHHMRMW